MITLSPTCDCKSLLDARVCFLAKVIILSKKLERDLALAWVVLILPFSINAVASALYKAFLCTVSLPNFLCLPRLMCLFICFPSSAQSLTRDEIAISLSSVWNFWLPFLSSAWLKFPERLFH